MTYQMTVPKVRSIRGTGRSVGNSRNKLGRESMKKQDPLEKAIQLTELKKDFEELTQQILAINGARQYLQQKINALEAPVGEFADGTEEVSLEK